MELETLALIHKIQQKKMKMVDIIRILALYDPRVVLSPLFK